MHAQFFMTNLILQLIPRLHYCVLELYRQKVIEMV